MKKAVGIILITFMLLSLSGCSSKEPSVVRTYEVTAGEVDFSNGELITLVEYNEMSDGTWKADSAVIWMTILMQRLQGLWR